jgi:sporulation protein YlmC with PRC-barrel domain
MKKYSRYSLTFVAAHAVTVALALSMPLALQASDNNNSSGQSSATGAARGTSNARGGMHVANENASDRGAENFTGREVRGADNTRLGQIADVIVDCQEGKIAFAIASSGGIAGVGDTLRIVPVGVLKRGSGTDAFTTALTRAQWGKLPRVKEEDFEENRVAITDAQQRQLADAGYAGRQVRADQGSRLARAAKLRGKSVRRDGQEIGKVQDILLDFDHGTATALLDPEDDFAGSNRNFVVPLERLKMSANDTVTTSLTRADFRENSGNQFSRSRAADSNRPLSPTGRTDNTAKVDPVLQSAARSIRQIWDANPDLAKLNLTVAPENGHLVFRGSVPNAELWEKAKDTAEGEVRGIDIVNHIAIEDGSH